MPADEVQHGRELAAQAIEDEARAHEAQFGIHGLAGRSSGALWAAARIARGEDHENQQPTQKDTGMTTSPEIVNHDNGIDFTNVTFADAATNLAEATLTEIDRQMTRIASQSLPASLSGPIIAIESALDRWRRSRISKAPIDPGPGHFPLPEITRTKGGH